MSKHTPEPWFFGRAIYEGHEPVPGDWFYIWPDSEMGRVAPNRDWIAMLGEDVDAESDVNARRIVACVNQCIGLDTDRLEKMVPGTLANLLGLKASRSQLTEARIAEIIDERMVKACYEPMGKEIAALIVAANLLALKGEK